ncbi:MAG: hypothetical protein ABI295_01175 [Xanthomarina sp.]
MEKIEHLSDSIVAQNIEKNITADKIEGKEDEMNLLDVNIDSLTILNLPYQINESFLSYYTVKRKLDYKLLNENDSIVTYAVGKFIVSNNPDLIGVLSLIKDKTKSMSYVFDLITFFKGQKKSSYKIGELSFLEEEEEEEEEEVFHKRTSIINDSFSNIKIISYNEVVSFETDDYEITEKEELELEINNQNGTIK